MLKMYNAEVLSKFPVVQHFPFGSLFSFERDPNAIEPPSSVHTTNQPLRQVPTAASPGAGTSEGTKAPWASQSRPLPPAGGSMLPASGRVPPMGPTAAPWASTTRPPPPPPGGGTAAPWSRGSQMMPPGRSAQLPDRSSQAEKSEPPDPMQSTKAPWAKR